MPGGCAGLKEREELTLWLELPIMSRWDWLKLPRCITSRVKVLHCVGYRSLVGSGVHSWGWDLGRASAYHGGEGRVFSPLSRMLMGNLSGRPYPTPNFTVPDTFTMVLDLEAGSLAFKVDDTYLGPAFSGLKGPLYPVISSVWGNSEVTLIYRSAISRVSNGVSSTLMRLLDNA